MKGNNKKLLLLGLYFILAIVLLSLMFGCKQSTQTSAPAATTQATTVAQAPTPTSQVINLKFSNHFAPSGGPTIIGNMFIDLLSKNSNGRIQVKMYDSEQLGKGTATLEMLQNGISDIAWVVPPYFPDRFQLVMGAELPNLGLGIPNFAAATFIREELIASGFNQGFQGLKFLGWSAQNAQYFFLKKQVLKAEDFKGMKIRVTDPSHSAAFESFGLTPVTMPMGDVYQSLERGIVDGLVTATELNVSQKWYESTKYLITNPTVVYGSPCMCMSQSAWDKLPTDIKLIFAETIPQWRFQFLMFTQDSEDKNLATLQQNGVKPYKLDPAEAARWLQLADPVISTWIAKQQAAGLPAQQMIDLMRKLAKRYS
jgi:TRAP-type transport system periplasmic protein